MPPEDVKFARGAAELAVIGSGSMPFASTAPLRREIERRIPERPFTVEFWDGTRLPASAGDGPDLLRALAARRRPRAAGAGAARPRPRLRQRRDRGRRHGRGDRAATQLEAADRWSATTSGRCCSGAVRAAGLTRPPRRPGLRAAPQRPPPHQGARRPRGAPPLRRLQRVLLPLSRRLDDLQLRGLLARSARRWRRRRRRSWRWSAASWR